MIGFTKKILLIGLVLFISSQVIAFQGEDAEILKRGKEMIIANCSDCTGVSEEELYEAIELLKPLLKRNSENNIKLHTLLGEAYRRIAFRFHERGSVERNKLLVKEKDILIQAIKLQPDNIDLLINYSFSVNSEESIPIYEKIISLDDAHAEAYDLLSRVLHKKDPAKALQYGLKAYELAYLFDKREVGRNYLSLLYNNATDQKYIDFNIRYRNDLNQLENDARKGSDAIKITLEFTEEKELYQKDLHFDVVFTNVNDWPAAVFNHQLATDDFFHFQLYPEKQASTSIPSNERVNKYALDTGDKPRIIELLPEEQFRLKTRLSKLFTDPEKIPDGGYILTLRYRAEWIRNMGRLPLPAFSDAVHFNIVDFVGGNKTSTAQ